VGSGGRGCAKGAQPIAFFFLVSHVLLRGNSHPELCAQRDDEGEGFLYRSFVVATAGAAAGFAVNLPVYISLRDEGPL